MENREQRTEWNAGLSGIPAEDEFQNKCNHVYKIPENAEPGKLIFTHCKKCGQSAAGTI